MRAYWDRRLQRIKEIAEAIGEKARLPGPGTIRQYRIGNTEKDKE
jgi:hypothetical protein